MTIVSSSSVVAVVFATWLVWQMCTLAVVVDLLVDAGRRRLALRRVRKRWAQFRTTHPEVFPDAR